MKKIKIFWWWILIIVTILILLVFIFRKGGKKIENKVISENKSDLVLVERVIDGDTLVIKENNKEESVRFIGIDAAEKNECFNKEATEELKRLVEKKKIKLEIDISQSDRDVYGRWLRYVYLEDGTLVNEKLIRDGFGKEYTFKESYKYQEEFKKDQGKAKEENLGIWKFCAK